MRFKRNRVSRVSSVLSSGSIAGRGGQRGSPSQSEMPGVKIPDQLPLKHLEDLDQQLRDHQARLLQLKRKMIPLQEEAAMHEMLIKLGRDALVLSALGLLYNDPALAEEIANDPALFAKKRGIEIPEGLSITVTHPGSNAVRVEAHFAVGLHKLTIMWDRNQGFLLAPTEQSSQTGNCERNQNMFPDLMREGSATCQP